MVNRLLDCKEIDVNLLQKIYYYADIWVVGDTALVWALHNEHLPVVNRLLDCKEIDVNVLGQNTALLWASQRGYLDVVNRLLDCKEIDVNVQDKVSGIVDFATSHLQILTLFFFLMCFLIKIVLMIKM